MRFWHTNNSALGRNVSSRPYIELSFRVSSRAFASWGEIDGSLYPRRQRVEGTLAAALTLLQLYISDKMGLIFVNKDGCYKDKRTN